MKHKAIIIDDEKNARVLLEGMLREYAPDIDVVETCPDLQSGVKAINRHQPDLVFLDIEMPGHSGLELLEFFNEDQITFSIIFTTAYNKYAIQAFKLSAVDYLLKPIEPDALEAAIALFKRNELGRNMRGLKMNLNAGQTQKISLPTANTIKFADLNDIAFLKGEGSYTRFSFADQSVLLVSRNLKYYEDALNMSPQFFRCHKSFIVNLRYVDSYVKSDGGYILMKDGEKIGISAEKVPELVQLMNNFSQ